MTQMKATQANSAQAKAEMTALGYTHAAHKQLAAGNERKAAGLLWKAAEATFLDLGRKRGIECGIECDGDSLIELAKALDAKGAVTRRYHRSMLGQTSLLRDHARHDVLESWYFLDVYRDTLDFVFEVNLPEALNDKR